MDRPEWYKKSIVNGKETIISSDGASFTPLEFQKEINYFNEDRRVVMWMINEKKIVNGLQRESIDSVARFEGIPENIHVFKNGVVEVVFEKTSKMFAKDGHTLSRDEVIDNLATFVNDAQRKAVKERAAEIGEPDNFRKSKKEGYVLVSFNGDEDILGPDGHWLTDDEIDELYSDES